MNTASLALWIALCAPQDPLLEVPVAPSSWTVMTDADALGNSARVELRGPNDAYSISVGAFGRFSWPFGALSDQDAFIVGNVVVIPDHLRYSDVFEGGWGVALEGSINLFTPMQGGGARHGPPSSAGGLKAGLYVSLQRDTYEGDRVSEGAAFVDPEDLNLTCGFIGVNVITDMGGGSYGQAHVGAGIARFESVSARVSLVGGGDDKQEMIQDSQEFAMEFRYRFTARVGPIGLTGGLGFRYTSSPEEGDGNLGDLLDAHPFWTFDVDFGVELGF